LLPPDFLHRLDPGREVGHRERDDNRPFDGACHCDYNVSTVVTKARIVRIGNSRGIRIPKSLLEQSELTEEVEIQAERGRLIISGLARSRDGWAEAARDMHAEREDHLMDEPTATEFDRDDWRW
jgi:antitoxin MazE